MSGFKRNNSSNDGILLWTLVLDDELVDKFYLLKELDSRGIKTVKGPDKRTGAEDINVEEWLEKKWGGVERNYCWLLFFITIFCSMRWPDLEGSDYEHYKNIRSDTLDNYIPNSKGQRTIIRHILEESGVFKWNDHYLTAAAAAKTGNVPFSKSFAIADGFQKVSYRSVADHIDTSKVFNNEKWLNNTTNKPITGDLVTTQAIEAHFKKLRITDDAVEVANTLEYKSKRSKDANVRIITKLHSFAALSAKDSQREYWNIDFKYWSHTGRAYHNLTSYPKALRHLLTIKGAPLWQVDCVAAHPFLLTKLYDEAKATESALNRERKSYSTRFSHNSDFYETVGSFGKIPKKSAQQSDEEYRKMVKDMFWKFIYDKPKQPTDCAFTQAYQRLYPILLHTINTMKTTWVVDKKSDVFKRIEQKLIVTNRRRVKRGEEEIPITDKQYKQLSYLMSRLEGDIVIRGVCHELAHVGVEVKGKMVKPWFLPLHDAIFCQQDKVKPIKQVMKRHWKEKIGYGGAFTSTSLG